jgi:hypothetical protein
MAAEYVASCIVLCRATVAGFYLAVLASRNRMAPTVIVGARRRRFLLSRDFACTAGPPEHGDRCQLLGRGGRLPQVVARRRPSPLIGEAQRTVKGKPDRARRSEAHSIGLT